MGGKAEKERKKGNIPAWYCLSNWDPRPRGKSTAHPGQGQWASPGSVLGSGSRRGGLGMFIVHYLIWLSVPVLSTAVTAIHWLCFPSWRRELSSPGIQGRTLYANRNPCFHSLSTRPPQSNKGKMSGGRVRQMCQDVIHLISCSGCAEFGNSKLFPVWPLVPAWAGKGAGSAWMHPWAVCCVL